MFSRFKSALYSAVSSLEVESAAAAAVDAAVVISENSSDSSSSSASNQNKFEYTRPHFLNLNSEDEIQVSADHVIRPIIVPRDLSKLPWNAGYAETINAGKSARNEDEAAIQFLHFGQNGESEETTSSFPPLQIVYFALFDGHAGSGASVVASNVLHKIIQEKLSLVKDELLSDYYGPTSGSDLMLPQKSELPFTSMCGTNKITTESLVVGALETAFWEMDQQIKQDRTKLKISGGCTALVALFILGKLYVANAGDSRAILVHDEKMTSMSNDFTPETEKERLRLLARQQPHLLGNHYTCKEFIRRLTQKDIQRKVLYRDAYMQGWSVKTVTADDLKYPVVCGEGKRSRVLATIGVTRGFGDHDLRAQLGNISIKPFLSSEPEVKIFDLLSTDVTANDVVIMATDGLWDIVSNEQAAEAVTKSLQQFASQEVNHSCFRYTMAAQDLVMLSRGKYQERSWRTVDNKPATIDDISVFVIPLNCYKEEFLKWKMNVETLNPCKS